jgi:putative ABC transport system substrate-binding protein
MPQAAMKLASAVDALFITNDNTALAALPSIIAVANKRKIPVYVSDTDAVVQGALAALGPNQYQVGVQTGAMIASVLDGASLNAIPVEYPAKTELFVNVSAAKKLGIALPEAVLSQATLVGG